MRRLVILSALVLMVCSCGTSIPKYDLYYWGGKYNKATMYEDLSYRTYKEQTPEVLCRLICTYEDMVQHPGGYRQVPPPGICAEYAYLLLQPETASTFDKNATDKQRALFGQDTDYQTLFKQKAEYLFAKEVELYPESEAFIKPLVRKFQQR